MGLTRTGPPRTASASAAVDQSNQIGSCVATSRSTLESISVPDIFSQPRVSARISSVLIPVLADPRSRATAFEPRSLSLAGCGTSVTRPPVTTNSTSVSGSSPYRSRMAWGIVTWPFDVIRIRTILLLPQSVLPHEKVAHGVLLSERGANRGSRATAECQQVPG